MGSFANAGDYGTLQSVVKDEADFFTHVWSSMARFVLDLLHYLRGMALQVSITAVQEFLPVEQHAVSLSVLSVFLQLGLAVSVSACQTIFNNRLPTLLHRYAPDVNATAIVGAGATDARHFVEPSQMPGFLRGYNEAITAVFYLPAACAVACLVSCALEWKSVATKKEAKSDDKSDDKPASTA